MPAVTHGGWGAGAACLDLARSRWRCGRATSSLGTATFASSSCCASICSWWQSNDSCALVQVLAQALAERENALAIKEQRHDDHDHGDHRRAGPGEDHGVILSDWAVIGDQEPSRHRSATQPVAPALIGAGGRLLPGQRRVSYQRTVAALWAMPGPLSGANGVRARTPAGGCGIGTPLARSSSVMETSPSASRSRPARSACRPGHPGRRRGAGSCPDRCRARSSVRATGRGRTRPASGAAPTP